MKKILKFVAVICAVLLAALGVGCRVENDPVEPEDPDEVLMTNPNATQSLSIEVLTDKVEGQTMIRWANAYMRLMPDVQISVGSNMSAMNVIEQWSQANKLPDIVWTAGDQHSFYSSRGYFLDLRKFLKQGDVDFFDDFYPSLIDATHFSDTDEGIWFMPRDYNQLVVYLNRDMFAEAGIPIPEADWDWDDFIEVCAKLRSHFSGSKYYPVEMDYTWNPLSLTFMANFGASVYKDGSPNYESAEMRACLDYLYDFIQNKKYVAIDSPGGFTGKYSAMQVTVRPNLPKLITTGISLAALPFPGNTDSANGRGYVGTGCSGYAITRGCKEENQALAWDFLKFCMSADGYEAVGKKGTIVPARMSLADVGNWTEVKDKQGNEIGTVSFVASTADPIDVNFCNNLSPINHDQARRSLIALFNELKTETYDFDDAINTFKSAVSGLN